MAKGKKSGNSAKLYYAAYKALDKRKSNKHKKIMRHLKKHPNDNQALNSLE